MSPGSVSEPNDPTTTVRFDAETVIRCAEAYIEAVVRQGLDRAERRITITNPGVDADTLTRELKKAR